MDGHASRGLPLADEPAAASTRSTSRWLDAGDLRTPVAAFAVSRALLFGFAWASLRLSPGLAFGTRAFPSQPWLDGWVRWDSFWYLEIALSGYRWTPGQESTVHFLPLFPMLARLAAIPLRPALDDAHAVLAAGVALALASFLVGLVGVRRLGRDLVGETAADRAVWLMALFPSSATFGAFYSESLFLALAVWALWFARRGSWPIAATLAGASAATRLLGVVVIATVALEALRQNGWRLVPPRREWVALGVALLPPAAVVVGSWLAFGDPLVFAASARGAFGRTFGPARIVEDALAIARHPLYAPLAPDATITVAWWLLLALATPALVAVCWRRIGAVEASLPIGYLGIALASGIDSTGRYFSVMFPLFYALALVASGRNAYRGLCAAFVPLLLQQTFSFAHWGSAH
ncbi:MAG TPA: mannosyltransferase family protein [Candidatus Binatia bacterium]|nr:mannosyltransferase family protein [Candidatus Binatia bacterium]